MAPTWISAESTGASSGESTTLLPAGHRRRESGWRRGGRLSITLLPPRSGPVITASLLLLLACAAGPADEAGTAPVPAGAPPEEPAEADFEALPDPELLLPAPAALRELLDRRGLGPAVAELAAGSRYKTGVIVKNLSAARTGAELGSLLLEAGYASPDVARARLDRIREGLEVFAGPALAEQLVGGLAEGAGGAAWVEALQGQRAEVIALVRAESDHPQLPLVLAGAWLQASWLTASALERTGGTEGARELLYRPEISAYFQSYVAIRGPEDFPESVLRALKQTLDIMDERTAHDPMSTEDIAAVRGAVEGLLRSM